ncbi:MAG: exosortase/archaeosortase family protein [Verrucomicrobia bacterium]|nr:exosortase/archaeosortase family protein [Verrucomicrobiota bacterium]
MSAALDQATTGTEKTEEGFVQEFLRHWQNLPSKWLFFGILAAWLLLFHFFGNSTLGYIKTASLFGWMDYTYSNSEDDAHGKLIPFVVLALFWMKRRELLAIEKRHWWPAISVLALGLFLHIGGFVVQQTRVSIVGFFVGLYGITGLIWGPKWLKTSFFPFLLFAFCLPLGTISETLTFPLRVLATNITTLITHGIFGINVIQDGTRIFNPDGSYQYEVAAACSGLRSLTATLAIAVVYAFLSFQKPWKRLILIASAFPLAVAANVFRLTTIIFSAEAFGQEAGNFVHDSPWLSLLPYLPAIAGLLILGYFLREKEEQESNAPC